MASEIQHFTTFPTPQTKPYVYQPFPKWVKTPEGKSMIVSDAKEYELVMGEPYDGPQGEPAPKPVTQEPIAFNPVPIPANTGRPSEKQQPVDYAVSAGIAIDKRWGAEKIKAAIEAHKAK